MTKQEVIMAVVALVKQRGYRVPNADFMSIGTYAPQWKVTGSLYYYVLPHHGKIVARIDDVRGEYVFCANGLDGFGNPMPPSRMDARRLEQYPAIKQAALNIGYDKGCINRVTNEEAWLAKCGQVVEVHTNCAAVEAELAMLSKEDLYELCCGEEGAVLATEAVSNLLNDIFEW